MNRRSLLLSSIIIFITTLLLLGLGITIKFAYVDDMVHYHTSNCYINSCTSTVTTCCTKSRYSTTCSTCYAIVVSYDLYLNSTTSDQTENYSKTSWGTTYDWNFCNQDYTTCYYDDRNISASLRTFSKYEAQGGIIGIVILCLCLFTLIVVTTIIIIMCICCNKKNQYQAKIAELNNKSNDEL